MPPAHTPKAVPRTEEPPAELPHELLQLVHSTSRRISRLESDELGQLAACNGPLSLHEQMAAQVQAEIGAIRRELQELKFQADDLERERERRAAAAHIDQIQRKLHSITVGYRNAVLESKQNMEKLNSLSPREQLFYTNAKAQPSRPEVASQSGDDAVMSTTAEVTEGLRRTMQIMHQQLEQSVNTSQLLEQSSATLRLVSDQYSTFGALLNTSKALVKSLQKADFLDRLILLFAFIFFILVCLFILKRRIVDKGVRAVGIAGSLLSRSTKLSPLELKRELQKSLKELENIAIGVTTAAVSTATAMVAQPSAPPQYILPEQIKPLKAVELFDDLFANKKERDILPVEESVPEFEFSTFSSTGETPKPSEKRSFEEMDQEPETAFIERPLENIVRETDEVEVVAAEASEPDIIDIILEDSLERGVASDLMGSILKEESAEGEPVLSTGKDVLSDSAESAQRKQPVTSIEKEVFSDPVNSSLEELSVSSRDNNATLDPFDLILEGDSTDATDTTVMAKSDDSTFEDGHVIVTKKSETPNLIDLILDEEQVPLDDTLPITESVDSILIKQEELKATLPPQPNVSVPVLEDAFTEVELAVDDTIHTPLDADATYIHPEESSTPIETPEIQENAVTDTQKVVAQDVYIENEEVDLPKDDDPIYDSHPSEQINAIQMDDGSFFMNMDTTLRSFQNDTEVDFILAQALQQSKQEVHKGQEDQQEDDEVEHASEKMEKDVDPEPVSVEELEDAASPSALDELPSEKGEETRELNSQLTDAAHEDPSFPVDGESKATEEQEVEETLITEDASDTIDLSEDEPVKHREELSNNSTPTEEVFNVLSAGTSDSASSMAENLISEDGIPVDSIIEESIVGKTAVEPRRTELAEESYTEPDLSEFGPIPENPFENLQNAFNSLLEKLPEDFPDPTTMSEDEFPNGFKPEYDPVTGEMILPDPAELDKMLVELKNSLQTLFGALHPEVGEEGQMEESPEGADSSLEEQATTGKTIVPSDPTTEDTNEPLETLTALVDEIEDTRSEEFPTPKAILEATLGAEEESEPQTTNLKDATLESEHIRDEL